MTFHRFSDTSDALVYDEDTCAHMAVVKGIDASSSCTDDAKHGWCPAGIMQEMPRRTPWRARQHAEIQTATSIIVVDKL